MDCGANGLTLPSEIWEIIMKRLKTRDILRASMVNKKSRACRLFVHTVRYTKDWSQFGNRMASMPNITIIEIGNISDMDEFEKLTLLQKLQDLSLTEPSTRPVLYNVLEKITTLRSLKMLYFPGNLDSIANSCTQLTQLILRNARKDKIGEINAIQKLTKLRKLKLTNIRNLPPVDMVGLTLLTNLTSLVLGGENFNVNLVRGDFNALINLKILKLNQMEGSLRQNISKLTNLEQLRAFQVKRKQGHSVYEDCLPLINLTHLAVDGLTTQGKHERMTDLTNLKALTVDISTGILNSLTKMVALKSIKFSGGIPSVGFLSNLLPHMTQLEDLHVWTWKDEGLHHLSRLDRLTSLSLYSLDHITSAGLSHSISQLTNLKYLDVSGKLLSAEEMTNVIEMPSLNVVKIDGALKKDCK